MLTAQISFFPGVDLMKAQRLWLNMGLISLLLRNWRMFQSGLSLFSRVYSSIIYYKVIGEVLDKSREDHLGQACYYSVYQVFILRLNSLGLFRMVFGLVLMDLLLFYGFYLFMAQCWEATECEERKEGFARSQQESEKDYFTDQSSWPIEIISLFSQCSQQKFSNSYSNYLSNASKPQSIISIILFQTPSICFFWLYYCVIIFEAIHSTYYQNLIKTIITRSFSTPRFVQSGQIIINMKGWILILVVVQVLAQLGGCAACPLTQTGPTTCVFGCGNCNNGICQTCCPGYYALANDCIACTDARCQSCNKTGATQVCNYCTIGYGVIALNTIACSFCNTVTQQNCQAINNCTITSTCVVCNRYALNAANQCLLCSLIYRNCNICDNTACKWCNTGYALNASAANKQCVSCNLPMCANCSNGPVCSICQDGYFLANGTCLPCTMPCSACSSATVCTACDSSLSLYYLVNSTCQPCNTSLQGCYTCANSSTFACNSCLDGYYYAGSTCTACVSPCLNCTSAAICTKCINASYAINSDVCELCSSQVSYCSICSAGFTCISCIDGYYVSSNNCLPCNNLFSDCISCDLTKCFACANGSQIQSDFSCSSNDCTSPCVTCIGNKTTCKSCILGYYLDNVTCTVCDVSCSACANASYCLTCAQELEFNSGVCTACLVGQNYNPFSMLCQACPAHCGACEWWAGCSTCDTYFEITARTGVNRCTDICGDLYVADLPCDSTIGIANDGCTDQCEVETDYLCTTTAFASQCSYNGNVQVSIVLAQQSIFSNNLKLGFKIHPYLFGMPTKADTQTYLQSIFQLTPLNTLTGLTISVDEKSEIVTFSIDHAMDISALDFTLTINFAYLAGIDPMFQYLSNVTLSQNTGKIVANGRLGDYQESSNLQLSKMIYAWSSAIGICAFCIMIFGTFGKELAGLDQAILCQNMFMLLIFYQGKLNLPLLSMSGLKYSTGLHFSDSLITMNQAQAYNLQLDSSSFLYNCNFNILAYVLPLVLSFVILLYKLRYKHLPAKRDLAQQTYEVIMGETILYLVVFNFSGMVCFAYLFYSHSQKSNNFYDNLAIFVAGLFSIFALFNFFTKPQIVGMFRSAFKTESEERDSRPRQKWLQRYAACISKRCCQQNLKGIYSTLTINFYLIYLIYLVLFMLAVTLLPFNHLPIVLVMQTVILIFIIIVRPHFNILEKARALLTWTISVIGTFTVFARLQSFILPVVFMTLLTLHILVSVLIIIASLWQQLKRKCNDRSEVVKSLMKEGQVDLEKDALKELILRFQNIERHNYSIDQEVQKIQQGYNEEINVRTHSPQRKEKEKEKESEKEWKEQKEKDVMDEELVQFQEEIIKEEHEHFRFQKGLDFFDKYNGEIDNELIKIEYPKID